MSVCWKNIYKLIRIQIEKTIGKCRERFAKTRRKESWSHAGKVPQVRPPKLSRRRFGSIHCHQRKIWGWLGFTIIHLKTLNHDKCNKKHPTSAKNNHQKYLKISKAKKSQKVEICKKTFFSAPHLKPFKIIFKKRNKQKKTANHPTNPVVCVCFQPKKPPFRRIIIPFFMEPFGRWMRHHWR